MNKTAIDLLKKDHEKVKDLLKQLVATTSRASSKRQQLLKQIQKELEVHTAIEEEIFYPAFREQGKKDDLALYYEALEEHRAVEILVLPDLLNTDVSSEKFSGRAKVLKELVEHHADEEEKEMFPKAKKLMSKRELIDLGEKMEALKKELLRAKEAA